MSASGSAKPFRGFGIAGPLPGSGDAYASVSVSADALASWNPLFDGSFAKDCATTGRLGGVGTRATVARGVAADRTGRLEAGASPLKRSSNDTNACDVDKGPVVAGGSNAKRSPNDEGDTGSDRLLRDLTMLERLPAPSAACDATLANGPSCAIHR